MTGTAIATADVRVWWTPDCGYQHVQTNPVSISLHCPDGVPHWSTQEATLTDATEDAATDVDTEDTTDEPTTEEPSE